ncbi:MAG TPA: class I SAM-dependent methyltransferase [Bacteroidota bacterium]|nr:class I SAM-dependent methyltransferase [Bacteroidota bacterium]
MIETQDEQLKERVREYWNAHPCGTQFTHLEWGSKEFFDEVERFRYETQPFMNTIVGFDRFPGKKLLEIGCGLGTDLLQFAKGGAVVTGVDLTPQSIELVEKRFDLEGLPVDARVSDAEHLPFNDGSFDVVYSFGVLHHTPNTQKAIDEVYRVLKPGGKIIIMLYHKNSLHVWLGIPLFTFWKFLQSKKSSLSRPTLLEDWVRVYDGGENPLGKAYSKGEAEKMFGRFRSRTYRFCDSYRRRFPKFINTLNQKLLAPWCGFWMVIGGEK